MGQEIHPGVLAKLAAPPPGHQTWPSHSRGCECAECRTWLRAKRAQLKEYLLIVAADERPHKCKAAIGRIGVKKAKAERLLHTLTTRLDQLESLLRDVIPDLPPDLQAKVTRVLQEAPRD